MAVVVQLGVRRWFLLSRSARLWQGTSSDKTASGFRAAPLRGLGMQKLRDGALLDWTIRGHSIARHSQGCGHKKTPRCHVRRRNGAALCAGERRPYRNTWRDYQCAKESKGPLHTTGVSRECQYFGRDKAGVADASAAHGFDDLECRQVNGKRKIECTRGAATDRALM